MMLFVCFVGQLDSWSPHFSDQSYASGAMHRVKDDHAFLYGNMRFSGTSQAQAP
jgi:hypothetical protein